MTQEEINLIPYLDINDYITYNSKIASKTTMSPLGVIPLRFELQSHLKNIVEAMSRYVKDERRVPLEWINEYNLVLTLLKTMK